MWPFTSKAARAAKVEAAKAAAIEALRIQTSDLENRCAQVGQDFSDLLEESPVVQLLFGFVDYFAQANGVTNRRERVNLAVSVFRIVYGDTQGIRMFGALDRANRAPNARGWHQEGFNAARYYEANGLRLVSDFFDGRLK